MWFQYAVEGYLAIKRKEILTQAPTQMNLEDMMLSEINKSPEDKHPMTPLL